MIEHLLWGASLAGWLGFEFYILLAYNRQVTSRNPEKGSKFVLIGLNALVLALLVGLWPLVVPAFLRPFAGLRHGAIPLVLLAFSFRVLVIRQLGAAFSANVGVQPGQSLRTEGLYRWVRHPAYAADVLGFVGLALGINQPLLSGLAFLMPTGAILYRIHVEEKVLLMAYEDDYRRYQAKTKRLIPFVL